jgi:hypothetical protein
VYLDICIIRKSEEILNPSTGIWNVCVCAYGRRTDVFGTDLQQSDTKQVNNYRLLVCTCFAKYSIFRYELAFVVGVTMDRWHHSQSGAVLRINGCGLVTALERFWREEGRSLIGFVWAKYFFPYNCTLTDSAVR